MSNTTQLSAGSELQGGKYRIEKVLGQGGFGITYEAEQVALGRKVAVKEFFMEEYCNRDGDTSQVSVPSVGSREIVARFRTKFVKEAKMIAGLNNPHIVKIHDVFEENGTAYYVMEYHDKGSLKDEVAKRGALPEKDAVKRIREVADALQYLHNQNILHLDVKPGNILKGDNGEMVLIDFGVSKCYDEEGEQTSSTPVAKSKGYAPSELYISGSVSHFSPATDIYSLGATFYYLVTGLVPPDASLVSDEGINLSKFAGLSNPTRNAIEAAMQPRRKDRPQSIAEFLKILDGNFNAEVDDDVTDFDEHNSVRDSNPRNKKPQPKPQPEPVGKDKPATSKKPAKWLIPLFVAIGVLIGAGVGIWWYQNRPEPVPDATDTPSKDTVSAVTTSTQSSSSPAQSSSSRTTPAQPPVSKTKLYVTTNPSGATVLLDGKKIGVSPLNGTEVPQGNHTVKLSLEGYESYTTQRSFGDNPVVINENLKIPNAKLYVTTTPSGASVYVDGQKVGVSPLNGKELPQGSHTVKITFNGYEDYERTFTFGTEPVVINESLKVRANMINGHEYVDLGLSVKWATCNVGASSPSDYGDYYAWGETNTKVEYTESNSITYKKRLSDISGNSTYDVARRKWGSSWRLPRKSELEELKNKCTWVWTTQGGHKGYKVTGPNGNSIFLPAAGFRFGDSLSYAEESGRYWSSSPVSSDSKYAFRLYFNISVQSVYDGNRDNGLTVRPVSE